MPRNMDDANRIARSITVLLSDLDHRYDEAVEMHEMTGDAGDLAKAKALDAARKAVRRIEVVDILDLHREGGVRLR